MILSISYKRPQPNSRGVFFYKHLKFVPKVRFWCPK